MNFLPRMERIVHLHRDRTVALATALAAAFLLLIMTDVAGSMSWYGLAATVLAGSILLGNSDSFAGLIVLLAMVLQWLTSGMDPGTWWVVPAAWLLLIAHVAMALVSAGPDQAPIPRAILALWVPRTVLVGLVTTLVAVVALLIEPTNDQPLRYGAIVALLALIVAVLAMIRLTRGIDAQTTADDSSGEYHSLFDRMEQ